MQVSAPCGGRGGLSVGAAAGCHWSLGPALSSELFGLRRFATLYCLLNYSTTLGAYLLATRLVRPRAPLVLRVWASTLTLLFVCGRCLDPNPTPVLHGLLSAAAARSPSTRSSAVRSSVHHGSSCVPLLHPSAERLHVP
jgi:hypothetical protein